MVSTFWLDNPSVLFQKDKIMNVWPSPSDTFAGKLNAVTRLVIFLTLLGYIFTRSNNILVTGIVTIIALVILFKSQKQKTKISKKILKEGFTGPHLYNKVYHHFQQPTRQNPLMNVLLPEIQYNPQRKPAAPAFNPKVEKKINRKVADPRLFLDEVISADSCYV